MVDKLLTSIEDSLKEGQSRDQKAILRAIRKRKKQQLWIAVAGKTGVGKSTLINVLFDPVEPMKTGNGRSGTTEPCTEILQLKDQSIGEIKYTDLPGLGETSIKNKEITSIYIDFFEKCDLVLWLFKSDDTALQIEEEFFQSIPSKFWDKIVFGLSKIDQTVNNGSWDMVQNKPDSKLIEHILIRIDTIKKLIGLHKQIIPFSIYKNYNLIYLVNAMLISSKGFADILKEKISIETSLDFTNDTLQEPLTSDFQIDVLHKILVELSNIKSELRKMNTK